MSESEAGEYTSIFGRLLKELAAELKSEDLKGLRQEMLALDRVDSVLASLRRDHGIHAYAGMDVVEEYERSLAGQEVSPLDKALDYIIRMENVELQLEVQSIPSEGFHIATDRLKEYHRILAANPKTEEIVLVWANEALDSIALGLDELREWLREAQERVGIPRQRLRPLEETILAALTRHRHVLQESPTLVEGRQARFDLADAFSRSLRSNLGELRTSAARRRTPERVAALRSLSESDQKQIEALFSASRKKSIDLDVLRESIEAMCRNVEIDNGAG